MTTRVYQLCSTECSEKKFKNHPWNSTFTLRHLISRDSDNMECVYRKQINEQHAGGIYLGKGLK